ncbi:Na+/H+ antiporter subunit E [Corynebacterium yudongzhengii]|uniref:Na+/H+ antiporter subunit E n=1 Tax=Corynebacterium yudongzhengii TaxID=2080740 RepID=A0A2U1T5S9_9CORY|nr:Na+/H+ antiporter subunit E [Corynebacterium yudongzhengii]AWB82663.1 Na+/H+ antiporter subunit E [Corynebacterium yudongzhengii]PWC01371.1 Na+/H+ antiporter subunit E [Corynebacterium yudongzhengii]
MLNRLRFRIRPAFVAWIVVMWCLLMGELSWANVFAGIIVGLGVVILLPLPAMPIGGMRVHWIGLIRFVIVWFRDLIIASVKVAWLALRPAPPPKTAIIRMPMRVSNELVLYFATVAYNLQPGGSVSDLDIANRMWTVHLLSVPDEKALEREKKSITELERAMIRIFEEG